MGRIFMDEKWRICLLDTKEQNPNHYIVLAIEAALKDHDQVELINCPRYADALSVAVRDRCNLFLAFDGEGRGHMPAPGGRLRHKCLLDD